MLRAAEPEVEGLMLTPDLAAIVAESIASQATAQAELPLVEDRIAQIDERLCDVRDLQTRIEELQEASK